MHQSVRFKPPAIELHLGLSSLSSGAVVQPAAHSLPLPSIYCTSFFSLRLWRRSRRAAPDSGQLAAGAILRLFLIYPSRLPLLRHEFWERCVPAWARGAALNEPGTVACWSLRDSGPWFTTPRRHIQISNKPAASHVVRMKKRSLGWLFFF